MPMTVRWGFISEIGLRWEYCDVWREKRHPVTKGDKESSERGPWKILRRRCTTIRQKGNVGEGHFSTPDQRWLSAQMQLWASWKREADWEIMMTIAYHYWHKNIHHEEKKGTHWFEVCSGLKLWFHLCGGLLKLLLGGKTVPAGLQCAHFTRICEWIFRNANEINKTGARVRVTSNAK